MSQEDFSEQELGSEFAGEGQDGVSPAGQPSSAEGPTGPTPPYMPYKTLLNLFERLEENGIPSVFDASYFGRQSGSVTAQTRAGLKGMGLIDDDYRPTQLLRTVVNGDQDERRRVLKQVAEGFYADILNLGLDATYGQLQEGIRRRGLRSADTVQKAITFFLAMTSDLNIEVSPHFKSGRPKPAGNGKPRTRRKPAQEKPSQEEQEPQETPATAPSQPAAKSAAVQRAEYVDMLMSLVKERSSTSDSPLEEALLDRIEKALGVTGEAATDT